MIANNYYDTCHECKIDIVDDLIEEVQFCGIQEKTYTIQIAYLLEKLTKEISVSKHYDEEACKNIFSVTLPNWYINLDEKHKKILQHLIQPFLNMKCKMI